MPSPSLSPIDCEGAWGECNLVGNDCSRTYTINVIASAGGDECEATDGQQETCNRVSGEAGDCPVNEDCQGSWGEADPPCPEPSETCNNADRVNQIMTYNITNPAVRGGKGCDSISGPGSAVGGRCSNPAYTTFETCNSPAEWVKETRCRGGQLPSTPCEGNWSEWGPCSNERGCSVLGDDGTTLRQDGTQTREYTITSEAECDGEACEETDGQEQTQACAMDQLCPVDCVGNWSDCVENTVAGPPSGKVTCTKTYNVSQAANETGRACPIEDGTTKIYCPKDDWNNSDDHSRWVPSSDSCICWPGTKFATHNNNKRCVPDTSQSLVNPYPVPPSQIRTNGTIFLPLNMPGQGRSAETGTTAEKASKCQERCRNTPECVYFNSFPNGGCHITDGSAGEQSGGGNPTARSGRAHGPEGFENFDNYKEGNDQWKGCIFIIIMIILVLIVFNCRKK